MKRGKGKRGRGKGEAVRCGETLGGCLYRPALIVVSVRVSVRFAEAIFDAGASPVRLGLRQEKGALVSCGGGGVRHLALGFQGSALRGFPPL